MPGISYMMVPRISKPIKCRHHHRCNTIPVFYATTVAEIGRKRLFLIPLRYKMGVSCYNGNVFRYEAGEQKT